MVPQRRGRFEYALPPSEIQRYRALRGVDSKGFGGAPGILRWGPGGPLYKNRQIRFKGCLGNFLGRNSVTNGFLNGYLGTFRPESGRKWPR